MKNTFKTKSKSKKKILVKPITKSPKRFHTLENNFNDRFPKN